MESSEGESRGSLFNAASTDEQLEETRPQGGAFSGDTRYRFADQPALLNSDLTPAEREAMQVKVEKLHRAWPKTRNYLPPPTVGKLADLDPAQLVKPPKGLEYGYVPIATRQELHVPSGK